jgi:predicted metal-dependent hydrolase
MAMQHTPPLPPRPSDDAARAFESDWLAKERIERNRKIVVFCMLFVIGVVLSAACASLAGAAPPALYLFALAGGLAMAAFAVWFPEWVANASSRSFMAFLAPNHGLAPTEESYSHIQAIAARGDIAGALKEYETIIAAEPASVESRIQAAELYATSRTDVVRAAALYNEVRRIEGVSAARDLYASQRLIDLYDGPLRQPSKSLTELRRIIDKHHGSREAEFARTTLAKRRNEQTRAGNQ